MTDHLKQIICEERDQGRITEEERDEMLAFVDMSLIYEAKLIEILESARRRAFWPHEADLIRKELGL